MRFDLAPQLLGLFEVGLLQGDLASLPVPDEPVQGRRSLLQPPAQALRVLQRSGPPERIGLAEGLAQGLQLLAVLQQRVSHGRKKCCGGISLLLISNGSVEQAPSQVGQGRQRGTTVNRRNKPKIHPSKEGQGCQRDAVKGGCP